MPLTREQLWDQLKSGKIAPVYVLFGAETQLRDAGAKVIADKAFGADDLRDFNETTFSLNGGGNLESALAAARQLPMMSARRVIKITDVRVSATGFRDTLIEAHEPVLSAYISDPSPEAVLIFVADELNGVRKMGKFLRDKTVSVEFAALDERQFEEFARREIQKAGAEIDQPTLRHLLAQVGSSVSRLTNEINKLAAAALPDKQITIGLIDELVLNTREISNFDLTDHLVAGRGDRALASLNKILDDGGEPLALLGLISYNYRRLLMAKDMMERGESRTEVAKVAKLRYHDQEPFLASARRASLGKLSHAIARIAATDLAIKTSIGGSGPAGSRMQLELLVCELASQDPGR